MSKTVKIADILQTVNERNQTSTCGPEIRQGWNSLLESILMANVLYIGFGYLMDWEVPKGNLAGMVHLDSKGKVLSREEFMDEMSLANREERKPACGTTFPDDSRRAYFVHHELLNDYRAAEVRTSRPGEIEAPDPTDSVEASKEYL